MNTLHPGLRQRGFARTSMLAATVLLVMAGAGGWVWTHQSSVAPEIALTDLTGKPIRTADLRGKVVLVNFWATSCTTCMKEMPEMVETFKRYNGKGLEFVAVAMQYDPPSYVLNYSTTRALPFRVAMDITGDTAKRFGDVQLTPTTFLIDKQGHIIKRYLGEPDFAELHKLIESELAT